MNQTEKLELFAERELKRNLSTLILDDDEGGFIVFGRYRLLPKKFSVQVKTLDDTVFEFSNKKTAMSWCVADSKNNINLATVIRTLDTKKQILEADIRCRSQLAERTKQQEFYDHVNIKMQPKIERYNSINRELEKCLNSAKYLQYKGFNDETARYSKHNQD